MFFFFSFPPCYRGLPGDGFAINLSAARAVNNAPNKRASYKRPLFPASLRYYRRRGINVLLRISLPTYRVTKLPFFNLILGYEGLKLLFTSLWQSEKITTRNV
ncbi:hypothetical protein P5V15_007921 [Pogonomyrmex californicus]